MADHLDKEKRSWNMNRIRGKDTEVGDCCQEDASCSGFLLIATGF